MSKKIISIAAVLVLCCCMLTGCGASGCSSSSVSSSSSEAESSSGGEVYESSVSGSDLTDVQEVNEELADTEYCTITVVNAGKDSGGCIGYTLSIANKTDDAISVAPVADSFTVNGESQVATLHNDVSAGQTASDFLSFDTMMGSEVSALVKVKGKLAVYSAATGDVVAEYDFSR